MARIMSQGKKNFNGAETASPKNIPLMFSTHVLLKKAPLDEKAPMMSCVANPVETSTTPTILVLVIVAYILLAYRIQTI